MAGSKVVELSAGPAAPPAPSPEAALLATVADPTRWRVLRHLRAGEACVCDLQEIAPVAGNLMSYHLRVLREAGLVLATRRGRWIHYRLAPDAADRLHAALPFDPLPGPGLEASGGVLR